VQFGSHTDLSFQSGFRGIWLIKDPKEEPDVVLYYAHGEECEYAGLPELTLAQEAASRWVRRTFI
jgi:hypothetical protein